MKLLTSLTFWTKIACLFLARSLRSTAILSLMILVAVSSLVLLSSLAVGVNDAMIRSSVGLYSGHITGFDLPRDLRKESLMREGVRGVLKRVTIPGMLSRGDRSEAVAVVAVDPAEETRFTALGKKIVSGRYPGNGERSVLVSEDMARRLGARPGDAVAFKVGPGPEALDLKVSGTFRTGIDQIDRGMAFCPYGAVEGFQPLPETWSAAVFLEDGVSPDAVIAAYGRAFGPEYRFESWSDLMPDLRQLIDLNYVSMGIVTVLVFGVVSLGIACAFVIFILKNLREYGIMKAMGVTPGETALLLFIEVILMNLAASCAGVLLGVAAVTALAKTGIDLTAFTSHNRYFAVSGVIFPRLTLYSTCLPPALAFCFSLASAVWPAWLVARKKAADILRIV